MRFVVYGAGAIGGVVGARLHVSGHDVVLVARGPHRSAIAANGLRLDTPEGSTVVEVRAVAAPSRIDWSADDVVLLCVKSQDTSAVLDDLEVTAPVDVPIVCLQNGVANEPAALRRFPNVYGAHVATPAAHLEPGVVTAYSTPVPGIIDVGRYPCGVDDTAREIRGALAAAGFSSQPVGEIRRWKYRKLVANLGNAAQAIFGAVEPGVAPIVELAVTEGEAALAAAGIDVASRDEDARRRADWIQTSPVRGRRRPGGSTWQSLQRGGSVEVDYLNGEIVLLGRLHDVPTPCNELLRRTLVDIVAGRTAPEATTPEGFLHQLRVRTA